MKVSHLVLCSMLVAGTTVVATAQEHHEETTRTVVIDEHGRTAAEQWYATHHDYRGLRQREWLAQNEETQLAPGFVLTRTWTRRESTVPRDLIRELPAAPRNEEYVFIGGHLVLVERPTHRVVEVVHLHGH